MRPSTLYGSKKYPGRVTGDNGATPIRVGHPHKAYLVAKSCALASKRMSLLWIEYQCRSVPWPKSAINSLLTQNGAGHSKRRRWDCSANVECL